MLNTVSTLHLEAAVAVIARSLPQCTAWRSCSPRTSGSAMALSHGLRPSLRDALVVVAGHRGDGDNGGGGDSDTRGPVAGAGRCDDAVRWR